MNNKELAIYFLVFAIGLVTGILSLAIIAKGYSLLGVAIFGICMGIWIFTAARVRALNL